MSMHRRLIPVFAAMVLALPACRDATQPTAPMDPAPAEAAAAQPWIQISAGQGHSCGVRADNLAYCWGENSSGSLGDGTFMTRLAPAGVVGGLHFAEVRATLDSCALTTEGWAYCWGGNGLGQLGNGTGNTAPALTPVAVAGTRRFTKLQKGFAHTCALTSSGAAFCWGGNGAGQLGTGSATGPDDCGGQPCSTRPVRAAGSRLFLQIRPGGEFTCGLATDRRTWCWGNNPFGQLGDGTSDNFRPTPKVVLGNHQFRQLSAGGQVTCGVDADHRAWCWGRNATGQVGDGSTAAIRTRPVAVAGGLSFSGVSPGVEHSCGVTTNGLAYCWGLNNFGQLGDGTTTLRRAPRKVAGNLRWDVILAGWQRTCGITTDGRAMCWGLQTGDGTTQPRTTPTPVVGPS
jgi:alpha-tubulin suppressor-like RCC1 family protein